MQRKKYDLMNRALEIAFDRMGNTSPNPAVGSLVVKDGTVISTGGTCPYGSSHAEVMAIKGAGGDVAGTDMYVTLEPCNHYGKTPPCTEAIINSGIKRVFVPLLDPNPLVAGRGVRRLSDAGVDVVFINELSQSAADLIRPFKKYILRKRPFIISKSALTLDGRIATKSGDSRWISSPESRYIVHKLRAKVDAIIVGKNTQSSDNPSLNVRLGSFDDSVREVFSSTEINMGGEKNYFISSLFKREVHEYSEPLRVLVGMPETLDPGDNMFFNDNYIIFEKKSKLAKLKKNRKFFSKVKKLNIEFLPVKNNIDFIHVIQERLAERGVMMALLEGGGRLTGSFFDAGEIDQFIYFIAPKIAGDGVSPLRARGVSLMSEAFQLRDVTTACIKSDVLYSGYRELYNFEMM